MMRRGQARQAALVAAILLSVLVIAAPAASALPASALPVDQTQPAPVIATAELRLWPEYDDPGLLVILSGQFAEGTALPLQTAFSVPATARNIQATYQDESGSLINRPFEIRDGRLTYDLPSLAFHVEYYMDRAPSGEQRDITFEFLAPYAVSALRVAVQQPARSSGFTLSPAAEDSQTGTDGLTYHLFSRRNLAAGESLPVNISYSKADSGLSAPQLAVAPTSGAGQPATGGSATTTSAATGSASWLPWLLIGLGVVLGAAVLAYWLLSQRRVEAVSAASPGKMRSIPTRPTPTAAPPLTRPQSTGNAVNFCTNCGHGLEPEDRFCSQCGAPRRS